LFLTSSRHRENVQEIGRERSPQVSCLTILKQVAPNAAPWARRLQEVQNTPITTKPPPQLPAYAPSTPRLPAPPTIVSQQTRSRMPPPISSPISPAASPLNPTLRNLTGQYPPAVAGNNDFGDGKDEIMEDSARSDDGDEYMEETEPDVEDEGTDGVTEAAAQVSPPSLTRPALRRIPARPALIQFVEDSDESTSIEGVSIGDNDESDDDESDDDDHGRRAPCSSTQRRNRRPRASDYDASTKRTLLCACFIARTVSVSEHCFPSSAQKIAIAEFSWQEAKRQRGYDLPNEDAEYIAIVSSCLLFAVNLAIDYETFCQHIRSVIFLPKFVGKSKIQFKDFYRSTISFTIALLVLPTINAFTKNLS